MEGNDVLKLQEEFEAYSGRIKRLDKIALELRCEEARAVLQKVWLRLRQGPVRAVVMGVSSAGKSTLINALAGQIVVPEAKRAMSPVPVWICSRNAPDAPMVEILKVGRDVVQDQKYCGLAKFLADYSYTAEEAGRGTGQEKFKDVIAARVNLKSDAISDAGITLIDTPGVGVSKQDDDRVKEILSSGCEIMVIVFMGNSIQEAGVKKFFRDLLVEENAPLRALLEENRVFFVCNIGGTAVVNARQNAQTHIKDAFEMQDTENRLFVVNARDARIRACGVYEYIYFLGGSCTREELKYAEEAEQDEKKRKDMAREQPELEDFCQSLGQAAQELCADPEARSELLAPIWKDLGVAQSLLENLIRERRTLVETTEFPVPPELTQRANQLEMVLEQMRQYRRQRLGQLNNGRAFSEKEWPLDVIREPETMNARCLIVDVPTSMGAFLLQDIKSENWHNQITLLVCQRMEKLQKTQLAALENPKVNPELQYWRNFFEAVRQILESVDSEGQLLLPPEKTDPFMKEAVKLLSNAEAAGRQALLDSKAYEVSQEKKDQLANYLAKKREKVLKGGIVGGWEKLWLAPNVEVDQLRPLATSAALKGRKAFLTAYRDTLWGGMNILRQELDRQLGRLCRNPRRQYKKVNRQIEKEKKAAKQKQLDELQKTLDAIREITGSAERTENNE